MKGTPRRMSWHSPPAPPIPLSMGAVDLWRINLDTRADALTRSLSEDECERAARFRRERDQHRWAVSRAALRSILASHLDRDPAALRFDQAEEGKPLLAPVSDEGSIHFNLSHSGDMALCGVSPVYELGVDIELAGRQIDELALASRTLGKEQVKRLASLEGDARNREFFRAWVAHEATVKCLGVGLGAMPPPANRAGVWLRSLDVGPRAAAALALNGPECELRCWEWPSQPR